MSRPLDNATPVPSIPSRKQKFAMGLFMTPVRRMLFHLDWSRPSRRQKNQAYSKTHNLKDPTVSALDSLPILDSITEQRPFLLSPSTPTFKFSSRRRKEKEAEKAAAAALLDEMRKFKPKRPSTDAEWSGSDSDVSAPTTPGHGYIHGEQRRRGGGSVAIQQEDPAFDAIVVTTLPHYPFCCHEDLLSMSREELLSVARALNARLPASSQIPVSDGRVSDAFVRTKIEVLVGIMPPVPRAPKAVRCAQSLSVAMDVEVDNTGDWEWSGSEGGGGGGGDFALHSPPSSPLALREKRRKSGGRAVVGPSRRGGVMTTDGPDDGEEDQDMWSLSGWKSPERFLERLDEEEEPNSDYEEDRVEEEVRDYYEEDEEPDAIDGHVMKKRKMSSDGRYARIALGESGFVVSVSSVSPREDSVITTFLKRNPVADANRNIFLVTSSVPSSTSPLPIPSSPKPTFRIPRKPVKAFLENEDSIDVLFRGPRAISSKPPF